MQPRLGLISLGCAKNLVDSEAILGMLSSSGFPIVNDLEEADVVIINTCGFINEAKKESIDTIIGALKTKKPVIVTGCLVERYLDELKSSLPEVSLFVPIREYGSMNRELMKLFGKKSRIVRFSPDNRLLATPPYQAYLRISDGCDHLCSYCAIPLIRGRFKSRPMSEVLVEAGKLARRGVKELIVVSQDTTEYGKDLKDGSDLTRLLEGLLDIGFYSIRLLYLYPAEVKDELIGLFKKDGRLSPYFDLPLQHASDRILRAMGRIGSKKDYKALVEKIRREVPRAVIRTTFIVGFPGEKDADFKELLDFCADIEFDHMGAFTYSREENTRSYDFPDQISGSLKKKRYDELMRFQKGISYRRNKGHVGEEMEGIVTGRSGKDDYLLRSYWNAPDGIDGEIIFSSSIPLKEGEIVNVKIDAAGVYDLHGVFLNKAGDKVIEGGKA